MTAIDIYSRLEIPKEEVFKHFLNSHTISRCVSPFFRIENFNCRNSRIDLDTSFLQKCVFSEMLQLFFNVKEITPNKKILFHFEGLIKGSQCINFIEDENNCLIKERINFSLWNQFHLPILNLILSLFFYLDSSVRLLRFKKVIHKDLGLNGSNFLNDLSTVRCYIVIDTNLDIINSFFEDVNKLSLWISPFVNIESLSYNKTKGNNEFNLTFLLPFLPSFSCNIAKKNENKIIISFSNKILKGKNIWSLFPCENELIIENSIQLEHLESYLKLIWLVLGNTIIKNELKNWNKRLKEIVERSRFYTFTTSPA